MKMIGDNQFVQEEAKILNRIPREIILVAFLGALLVAVFFNIITSLFVFAGGIVSAASFVWLKDSLTRFFQLKKKGKILISVILSYILRLVLIMAVFSIIIIFFSNKIFAFIGGFSAIIIVLLAEAIAAFSRIKEWKN